MVECKIAGSRRRINAAVLTSILLAGTCLSPVAVAQTIGSGSVVVISSASSLAGPVTLNGGGLQWAPGVTSDISSKLNPLGPNGGIFDTNSNNVTLATPITGSGALTKIGAGTLTLSSNGYPGGTIVSAGVLTFQGFVSGNIVNNGSV